MVNFQDLGACVRCEKKVRSGTSRFISSMGSFDPQGTKVVRPLPAVSFTTPPKTDMKLRLKRMNTRMGEIPLGNQHHQVPCCLYVKLRYLQQTLLHSPLTWGGQAAPVMDSSQKLKATWESSNHPTPTELQFGYDWVWCNPSFPFPLETGW